MSVAPSNPLLDILYEDADLLVVNKPAGLVCHPTKGDTFSSLISRARHYLNGPAFLVNRLDRETSGVVLAAKNDLVAGELGKLWQQRAVAKEYLAIVHGSMRENEGRIDLPLGKDEQSEVAIKDCVRPDGAAAQTEFTVERRFCRGGREFTLARVRPLTGRKHQIRIHLAAVGHAIVGDKLYGDDPDAYLAFVKGRLTPAQSERLILPNQALCAISVRLTWRGTPREFTAAPDPAFAAFLALALADCV